MVPMLSLYYIVNPRKYGLNVPKLVTKLNHTLLLSGIWFGVALKTNIHKACILKRPDYVLEL